MRLTRQLNSHVIVETSRRLLGTQTFDLIHTTLLENTIIYLWNI